MGEGGVPGGGRVDGSKGVFSKISYLKSDVLSTV